MDGIPDLTPHELGMVASEAKNLHMRYFRHRRLADTLFVTFTWDGAFLERCLDLKTMEWKKDYLKNLSS